MRSPERRWRFWVDRGGTFTDVVAQRPDGELIEFKLLSRNPDRYQDATVEAVRRCLNVVAGEPIPTEQIVELRVGTTVATNALLERTGSKTALFITEGFGDLSVIGDQRRPDLFALDIRREPPLTDCVFEITERLNSDGEVVTALDEQTVHSALEQAKALGCKALAIALVHATINPRHERRVAELAARYDFGEVVVSHEVSALPGFLERMQTAGAEAYLQASVSQYIDELRRALPGVTIRCMQSSGALADAAQFRARHALLSGPAGGVMGAVRTAQAAGVERLIGFDMGGTSTDVFHCAGRVERVDETQVAGVVVRSPSVQLHTVAAGGGSRLGVQDGRATVGPESAGAYPGPACYGRAGPAAVTDANLVLGRLLREHFPAVFGQDGRQPLDPEASHQALDRLSIALHGDNSPHSPEQLAYGYIEIAVENMANAIRRITVEQGIDTQDYTLVAFGGAGGQLACLVAQALEVSDIFIPEAAGVLSALGIGLSELSQIEQLAIDQPLAACDSTTLQHAITVAAQQSRQRLADQGVANEQIRVEYSADLHFDGTDTTLTLPFERLDRLASDFLEQHRQVFGFADQQRAIRLRSLTIEALGGGHGFRPIDPVPAKSPTGRSIDVWAKLSGRLERVTASQLSRDDMAEGQQIKGPALITEPNSCIVVEPGWMATRQRGGLRLRQASRVRVAPTNESTAADPMRLEIIHNRLMAIAEQMGEALRRTAHSVNVRERMDFSCAIYTANGELVANAPHIPVHLGSMGAAVQSLLQRHRSVLAPGSAWLLNNPYLGGTHLPDLTVVSPRFDTSGELVQLVAARAHHADVGGITPGSVPAESHRLDEEGIIFDGLCIVDESGFHEAVIRDHLGQGPHPARQPDLNLVDLRAQIAACHQGLAGLDRLDAQFGAAQAQAYLHHILDHSADCVRQMIRAVQPGTGSVDLDDGTPIRVSLTPDRHTGHLVLDFQGTGTQHAGNRNAPTAITRAAVLYVLRCLLARPLPLNDGCLRPVELRIPAGSLLNPEPPAAVVAGNVETSQAIVNVLLEAFGSAAHAQGTMNNLSFGNDTEQYYETICGGAGAGAGFAGADAVQTHMTNSRMTDVEVLERRHSVRVEQFGLWRQSGGAGRSRGGSGAIRRLRFLSEMDVSVLSSQRKTAPRGLHGGGDGTCGRNTHYRNDGTRQDLGPQARLQVQPGDCIEIRTPGGGGWGKPED